MKNTKKTIKLLALLLALCCTVTTVTPVFATSVHPYTDDTDASGVKLSINSNGKALCTVFVNVRSYDHQAEVIMSLYQVDGGNQDPIKSWTISGKGNLSASKAYYVMSGHDYQVTANITIKDSNGKLIESFPVSSAIVHY